MSFSLGIGLGLAQHGGGSVAPIVKPLGAGIGFIGDSFVANGLTVSGASATYPSTGFSTYVAPLGNRGGLVTPLGALRGVGGETMATIAGRTAALVAYHCAFVVVEGGINDIVGGATAAAIAASRLAACMDFVNDGSIVVSPTITPTFGAAALTGPQEAVRQAANALIRAQASGNRIIVADVAAVLATGGDLDSGGLHPNNQGALKYGRAIAQALVPHVTPGDVLALLAAGTNYAANPTMSGSGGTLTGATGVMASNWDLQAGSAGGATVVASKDTDGKQVITITGASTGGAVFMQDFVSGAPGAGHVIEQSGAIEYLADPVGLSAIEVPVFVLDSGFAKLAEAHLIMAPLLAADGKVPVLGPQIASPASGAAFVQNQLFLYFAAGTVNVSFKVHGLGTHQVS